MTVVILMILKLACFDLSCGEQPLLSPSSHRSTHAHQSRAITPLPRISCRDVATVIWICACHDPTLPHRDWTRDKRAQSAKLDGLNRT
ncbi:hypothetical protein LSTR_LSTR016244 [Laodelphax striatellus]|nr:hypothetical protein LSTR_LSTR016244 [Laodelphax striatellus]